MKNFLILLILVSLFSCGKKQEKGGGIIKPPTVTIGFDAISTSDLSAYKTSFDNKRNTAGVADEYPGLSMIITSDDICVDESKRETPCSSSDKALGKCSKCNDGVLGQCIRSYSNNIAVARKIVIDAHYWKNLSKASREELMYHELGHCVLGRSHAQTESSIMYPYHLGPAKYADVNKYDDYMAELFGVSLALFVGISFDSGNYASTLANASIFQSFDEEHLNCLDEEVHLD